MTLPASTSASSELFALFQITAQGNGIRQSLTFFFKLFFFFYKKKTFHKGELNTGRIGHGTIVQDTRRTRA